MERILKYFLKKFLLKFSYKPIDGEKPIILYNDWIGKNIIIDGFYEKQLVKTILDSFNFNTKKHACIDVGANIGNHSLQFEKYFNRVLGFEPQLKTFLILKLNTEYYPNISIYNYGLAESNESLTFKIPYNNIGSGSQKNTAQNHYTEKVNFKNYDQLFDEEISYVKIDVEGNELNVIKGMEKSIIKYKPIISFEMRGYNDNSKSDLIKKLNNLGYFEFYVPKNHYIKRLISSSNILALIIKRIIILLHPQLKNELVKIDIINEKKDYSLITTHHSDSNFKIKK